MAWCWLSLRNSFGFRASPQYLHHLMSVLLLKQNRPRSTVKTDDFINWKHLVEEHLLGNVLKVQYDTQLLLNVFFSFFFVILYLWFYWWIRAEYVNEYLVIVSAESVPPTLQPVRAIQNDKPDKILSRDIFMPIVSLPAASISGRQQKHCFYFLLWSAFKMSYIKTDLSFQTVLEPNNRVIFVQIGQVYPVQLSLGHRLNVCLDFLPFN